MKVKSVVILLFLTAATSCVSYKEVELTSIAFKDVNTANNKVRVALNVEVDNPNNYSIKLSKPRLHVIVGNEELQDWTCPQKIKLDHYQLLFYNFYIKILKHQKIFHNYIIKSIYCS